MVGEAWIPWQNSFCFCKCFFFFFFFCKYKKCDEIKQITAGHEAWKRCYKLLKDVYRAQKLECWKCISSMPSYDTLKTTGWFIQHIHNTGNLCPWTSAHRSSQKHYLAINKTVIPGCWFIVIWVHGDIDLQYLWFWFHPTVPIFNHTLLPSSQSLYSFLKTNCLPLCGQSIFLMFIHCFMDNLNKEMVESVAEDIRWWWVATFVVGGGCGSVLSVGVGKFHRWAKSKCLEGLDLKGLLWVFHLQGLRCHCQNDILPLPRFSSLIATLLSIEAKSCLQF